MLSPCLVFFCLAVSWGLHFSEEETETSGLGERGSGEELGSMEGGGATVRM